MAPLTTHIVPTPPQDCVVVNVRIPFWSLVVLLIKYILASFVALVILSPLFITAWLIFMGVVMAVAGRMGGMNWTP